MPFDKRDCRLERLVCHGTVLDHDLLTVLALNRQVLIHLHVGRSPKHETDDETDRDLTHDLVLALQAFLVTAEDLDKVVQASEEAEPHRGDDHQDEIDVPQSAEQQHRDEDGDDDDDTTHRRHPDLLDTERVDLSVALRLRDLLALQELDELLAEPSRDNERQNEGQQRPEGDVAPHAGS